MFAQIPAQCNSYDCGVYLTKYAQLVCKLYPTSTTYDLDRKFSNYFNTKLCSQEDVEEERHTIKAFCDE